jgi:hypothetical protein
MTGHGGKDGVRLKSPGTGGHIVPLAGESKQENKMHKDVRQLTSRPGTAKITVVP